ncbi:MAG: N-6 DNA methylase [Rhizobiales bacterium]|nr:type I restriction-modification system subunit M [Hyphomicrobiales bacterium]NRB13245.1 N-6 DNA methylase [Hyphomicrobiales bacterium]
MNATDIVSKLWGYCDILRDEGRSYDEYLDELTYILFFKMAHEVSKSGIHSDRDFDILIPEGYRWTDLESKKGIELLAHYKKSLLKLGESKSILIQKIFANAGTAISKPITLQNIITEIKRIDWFSEDRDAMGDAFEGLLEKSASEGKKGAGQYFTPRPLINMMVELMKPQIGEVIQDPACGTGGFLIAANNHLRDEQDFFDLSDSQKDFQYKRAIYGMEFVPRAHRLGLMNMMLHGIEEDVIALDDTLSPAGERLPKADLILANPPFGSSKGGGKPSRDDFTFETSNKQLAFMQHIYRGLKPGGRAAVVIPDNVLFEDNMGRQIREDLMDKCDLHTILRLPTGIFYAQGVKTNVLFFTRGKTDKGNTKETWVYDLRTNMPSFGKRTPLTKKHFEEFVDAYGEDPYGKAKRKDEGEQGRFRKFTRAEIKKRNDNLDISWLRDENVTDQSDLPEPDVIATQIMGNLQTALTEMEALQSILDDASGVKS